MLQCSKTFVLTVAKSTVCSADCATLGTCLINNLVRFITQTWRPEVEQEFQRGTESTATPARRDVVSIWSLAFM